MSSDYVKTKADFLGVEICRHDDSLLMWFANVYHDLNGNPWFERTTFMTLYPRIYVPDQFVDRGNLWESCWRILDHELVHWVRQRDYGVWRWVFAYVTDISFREHEEKLAMLRDIKNGRRTPESAAHDLRGPLYNIETPVSELIKWFRAQTSIKVPRRPSDGV